MAPTVLDTCEPTSTSRFYLRVQAVVWRFLMAIGMYLHKLAPPRPSSPSFTRQISTTISQTSGAVILHFYVPKSYDVDRRSAQSDTRYPVLINFHGGGFTLGAATDDARWATAVTKETGAVVVSVDYRLAPEHPFPTAVEDGVDSVMYLVRHAQELHLDPDRIALSGFSAGGNLSFTVPMRLFEELNPAFDDGTAMPDGADDSAASASNGDGALQRRRTNSTAHPTKTNAQTMTREVDPSSSSSATTLRYSTLALISSIRPVAVISFYPSTDYSLSRTARRLNCPNPAAELSPALTSLFDSSYLCPASTIDYSSPFLSPVHAPDHLLRHGLPDTILLFTCEWDMLAQEGRGMGEKLKALGKRVVWQEMKGKPHGWDKSPNPWREAEGAREAYTNACKELRRVFGLRERERDGGGLAKQLSLGSGGKAINSESGIRNVGQPL